MQKHSRSIDTFIRLAWAIPVLVPVLTGCGQSKEEKAVDRMLHRKTPAFCRLVNFGAESMSFWNKGMRLSGEIAPGDHTNFIISSPGEQKIEIKSKDKVVFTPKMSLVAGECQTILVSGNNAKIVTGEVKDAETTKSSVRVFNVGSPKPVSVKAESETLATDLAANSEGAAVSLTPGNHTFSVTIQGDAPISIPGDLRAADSYTIAIVNAGGKTNALLFTNSPQRRPTAAGASPAG